MPVHINYNSPGIQKTLGLPPEVAKQIDRVHWSFAARWPQLTIIALLVVAALWTSYHYWRDGTRPSWWVKAPLVVLRLLAMAALVLMLSEPILRLAQSSSTKSNVIVMVDTSQSMGFADPRLPRNRAAKEAEGTGLAPGDVAGRTRLERANAALNHARLIAELGKKYNVRVYTFASGPKSLTLPADAKKRAAYSFALTPDENQSGETTQMGAALRQPLEDLAGQPIAGAIVVSDGGSNQGEDPVLAAQESFQTGKVPVSTLGLGDPTKTKDVALLSVLADDVVRVNNTVTVYAALSHRGYAGKTVAVTLLRGGTIVGRETIRLGADEAKQEVHFTYVPTQPGRFNYTVTVTPLPGETTLANNKRGFVQTVISKKLKILYVEGEPRYEYRYLRNAVLRDTSLDFACLLLSGDDQNQGNFRINGFPQTEKELFEYDIVVLGDVPRTAFSDTQLQALRRFVEDRGASMLVIAGENHMPHEFAGTPLEAVLPVVLTASPEPVTTDEPVGWQLTPEGKRSTVTQLEDNPDENARVWQNLPGMEWAAGVVRAKPGATVLAVHPTRRNADGPYPLVATQPFGSGKCYISLVDGTWHWRWRVGDRYFYRYWGQVFRSLTPKELPGNSRFVQINADRTNYRLSERVTLNARLLDAYYHPVKAKNAVATVKSETGQTQQVTLEATPNSPGLYTAQFQPDRVGHFDVSLISPANSQAKASAGFVVESLALEKQKPELDETLLKKVAASGGGKYYTPDTLTDWPKTLRNNALTVRSEQEYELWDAPGLLALFLTPLGLEWLIRKRKGLL